MQQQAGGEPPWWEQEGVLHRLACDVVHAELTAMRRRPPALALPWARTVNLSDDLGADSLELLTLATRWSEMLHIHRAGIEDYLLARLELDDWASVALTSLRRYSAELTFRTSGSTGQAKPCTHHISWLWQEARALAELLPNRRRVLFAVPGHHIYGFLFTVLLPHALGLTHAGHLCNMRHSSPAALAGALNPGDLVVAHPDYWRAVCVVGTRFPNDVVGVTSGAPCPDDLARDVRAAGLERLVQVFGSSETAGLGWRDDETAPYQCFAHWQAQEDDSALLRCLPDGTSMTFPLQDRLVWHGTRHFVPKGRRDNAVQVGGVNVSPAQTAEALRQHPGVQDASVRLMRPDEGHRLKAFVVPRDGTADTGALANELADWVRAHLPAAERPATFTFGPQLPRQASGKPADWIIGD